MKKLKVKTKKLQWLFGLILLACGVISVNAQSTNVDYPTPLTTNEVNGKIPARDIGDSRLTTHYYFFNGEQGDIFIKVLTSNLDGDIDIFVADTLRPITKINIYSDNSTETGREIYLRKSEKLILRVQGRTPTDLPATYSVKFEGSFLAVNAPKRGIEEPKLPEVKAPETDENVKVNSVGTIIKTAPKKVITVAKTTPTKTPVKTPVKKTVTPTPVSTVENNTEAKNIDEEKTDKKEVVSADDLPKKTESKRVETKTTTAAKSKNIRTKTVTPKKTTAAENKEKTSKASPVSPKPTAAEELKSALENVNLVILFKDGTKIERPMNEVLRFTVDKGILTVISKDGAIKRYSIIDVAKTTIE